MQNLKFVKPEKIWLADHPELREKWVQERIADDPSILGIGDLVLKDKERSHPRAGRLDLLLQDSESTHRYEVDDTNARYTLTCRPPIGVTIPDSPF
jgi:hypothetical protein